MLAEPLGAEEPPAPSSGEGEGGQAVAEPAPPTDAKEPLAPSSGEGEGGQKVAEPAPPIDAEEPPAQSSVEVVTERDSTGQEMALVAAILVAAAVGIAWWRRRG